MFFEFVIMLKELLKVLNEAPQTVQFSDVIKTIDENYNFVPTEFKNGETVNLADQNNGSCKIFSFAQLHNLSQELTLQLFGDYYREDVLKNPDNTDHQNIRNFMVTGWQGVTFLGSALTLKNN